jgi:hypothetical protein
MAPARVTKIDPATLLTTDQWTGTSGQNYCDALIFDGTYFYAGLETSPAQVVKLSSPSAAIPTARGSIPHRLVGAVLI